MTSAQGQQGPPSVAPHGSRSGGNPPDSPAPAFSPPFTMRARRLSFDGDRAVTLADANTVALIESGAVDLFAVDLGRILQGEALLPRGRGARRDADGGPSARWTFVCRVEAGTLLPGASVGPSHTLLGRPLPGAVVSRLDISSLRELMWVSDQPDRSGRPAWSAGAPAEELEQEFVQALDEGLIALSYGLREDLPPREFTPLEPSSTIAAPPGTQLRLVDKAAWLEVVRGAVRLGEDATSSELTAGDTAFITDADSLISDGGAELRSWTTTELLHAERLWSALSAHEARYLYAIDARIAAKEQREIAALEQRREHDRQVVDRARLAFAAVLSDSKSQTSLADVAGLSPALAATRLVGARMGITITAPPGSEAMGRVTDPVEAVALASRVRTRTLRLSRGWWKADAGPLVGYRADDGSPVALLPARGGYELIDPATGRVSRVDSDVSTELLDKATIFYRPLPPNVRGGRDLLRFGLIGSRRDVLTAAWAGLLVAVLGLTVPILSGLVLGRLVSEAARTLIVEVSFLVLAAAIAAAIFSAVQNLAVLRLEGRVDSTVQAAIWDHLLALPVRFFAQHTTGELSTAALAVDTIRETLSGVATTAGLALLVGALNLVLLFFYSIGLALMAGGLILVAVAACWVAGRFEIRLQRELFTMEKGLSSEVFQLLTGLSKLRVAGAEDRAFAHWASDFTRNRAVSLRARRVQNLVTIFNAGFVLVCSLTIFAVDSTWVHLSTGAFISFFTAFSLLLASTLQFTGVVITVLAIVPMLQDLEPIFGTEREVGDDKADPGELSGAVTLNHVSYAYSADSPLVIDDISLSIAPGEFVAIVGSTGCGKSTLVRLLLGFAQPTSGAVLYDGQDLTNLDVTAVRRQCGVVLQNGSLLAGDIKTNITGNSAFTIDEAWEAARAAGLDQDIESMPMGMYTILSEGASTLSGGQRQRLMIARALVAKPRILILDEATSALDNPTQARVAESTRRMRATRIVIAHRLSTVLDADRILVLDGGRIVQQGAYDELLQDETGLFARLVRRQIA